MSTGHRDRNVQGASHSSHSETEILEAPRRFQCQSRRYVVVRQHIASGESFSRAWCDGATVRCSAERWHPGHLHQKVSQRCHEVWDSWGREFNNMTVFQFHWDQMFPWCQNTSQVGRHNPYESVHGYWSAQFKVISENTTTDSFSVCDLHFTYRIRMKTTIPRVTTSQRVDRSVNESLSKGLTWFVREKKDEYPSFVADFLAPRLPRCWSMDATIAERFIQAPDTFGSLPKAFQTVNIQSLLLTTRNGNSLETLVMS
jgi:hypothetical protein